MSSWGFSESPAVSGVIPNRERADDRHTGYFGGASCARPAIGHAFPVHGFLVKKARVHGQSISVVRARLQDDETPAWRGAFFVKA